ncbi:MAG: GNAT family N-acetyltransferase [Chitinophagaceae bacterium]|nr:GNAT family N-acetyltransferase [Chitinophagaceae bacterium]
MDIRAIAITDNAPLAKMIRAVFEEYNAPKCGSVYSDPTTDNLFDLFQKEKSILWVAEMEGKIVGCCGVYPTEGLPANCVELVKFYLAAHARGKGIGKALMQKSIESAEQFGYSTIYLESFPDFSDAISIYEKRGFKKIDKPLGNSGHTSCNIWMLKNI